ncbi:hypothetical protein EEL34_15510 [Muribaculaceae bacterium Isolate-039 (Harlan)]|nr:hypothetical protein EEL34_15510 [Muribaculaceae bacterium Isolate-039 (Harlan)]
MDINKIGRYKFFLQYLVGIGFAPDQKGIGQMIGYNNPSAFSQVINGKKQMPKDFTAKLKRLYPDLNEAWLESGEGKMLLTENGGQNFFGDINGGDNNFSGRDMTVNPPCTLDSILIKYSRKSPLNESSQRRHKPRHAKPKSRWIGS